MSGVVIENLSKVYGDTYAVQDVNLEIKKNSMHFFLGPSGCGKTTTLRILAGLEKPTSGKIYFDGQDMTHRSSAERNVAMVFQNYALWPHMTVKENIAYGLKLRKISSADVEARIREVTELTQLGPYISRLPGQLSGGQQQRVALARALAIKPHLLFLDEPLSNLDARLRLEMRDAICDIHQKTGITMIYVTHDQKEALSMGSFVSVMRKGKLIQTSTPQELYHQPATPFIAQFIGQTNLIEGKVSRKSEETLSIETPLGSLTSTRFNPAFQLGDQVYVSIRPEGLDVGEPRLSSTGGEGRPELRNLISNFHVTDTSFLGEAQMLYFASESGGQLKAKLFHSSRVDWRKGEHLKLSVEAHDVVVLPFLSADELAHAT